MATMIPPNFKSFNVAMIQLGEIGEDKLKNLVHAREMVLKAAKGGADGKADLVVLPEIFNSPTVSSAYRPNSEPIPKPTSSAPIAPSQLPSESEAPSLHMLSKVAQEAGVWIIGGSIPEKEEGSEKVWNTATVWDPAGKLVAKHRKIHLYDCDFPGGVYFMESKSMSAGDSTTVFNAPFGTIAIAICYDIRFPSLIQYARQQNPDICAYILPSAFNMSSGPAAWEILQRVRAIDNQIFVGMCSPARDPTVDYVSYGHTLMCSPQGKVISTSTPEEEGEAIVFARVDSEAMKAARSSLPLWNSQRTDVYGTLSGPQ